MQNMNRLITAVSAIALVCTQACQRINGDGPTITKSYSIANFNAVDAGIDAEIYVTQDSNFNVQIEGQSNILDEIETPIVNGELRLQFKKFANVGRHNRLVAYISAPNIRSLGINGAGTLRTNSGISANSIDLKINGSGNLIVQSANVTNINTNISGSGRVTVNSGNALNANIKISGSGDVDMANIKTDYVSTKTSGSGTITVWADKTLDINISGSGNVYYYGNPIVNTSISGSGRVIKN